LKVNEITFKIKESGQENATLNSQITKLKQETDYLNETLDKLCQERHNITLKKLETEEHGESSKRELAKQFQTSLSSLLTEVIEAKNKYQKEIFKLKADMEILNSHYEGNIINKT